MGHIAYLGEGAPVTITGTLRVTPFGQITWDTTGADDAEVWVSGDGGAPQLVARQPAGDLAVDWIQYAHTYRFSLAGRSGDKTIEIVAVDLIHPALNTPAAEATRTVSVPAAAAATPDVPLPGTSTGLLDTLDHLPGGKTAWLAGGGLALLLLLKRRTA